MKTAIIGTGNVAYHLAKRLDEVNYPPLFIAGLSVEKSENFIQSLSLSAEALPDRDFRDKELDFILIAVPDREIHNVVTSYRFNQQSTLLHTSGSQPIDLLKGATAQYGVFYPFQTFSKQKAVDFSNLPILIEGNAPETVKKIEKLTRLIGTGGKHATSAQRLKVHLAAVFASNFTNNLLTISERIMQEADMELGDLEHLIRETVDKALAIGPVSAQTGPAIRNDSEVLKKHLDALSSEELHQLYMLHTHLIQQQGK